MSQPKFEDGPPVPLMVEGLIDAAMLHQLFVDLAGNATIISVREKGTPTSYAPAEELSASAAMERLLAGTTRAVQIRYQFDGHEWTDTIMLIGTGFRVVRCRHDPEATGQ